MIRLIMIMPVLMITVLSFNAVNSQNTYGKSDDYSRIAVAPVIPDKLADMDRGVRDLLTGKMRQMIVLNGLSAEEDLTQFVMYPELMVVSDHVSASSPPIHTVDLEVVFNLSDRYTGNIFASTSESLKGAGQTQAAAYKAAFKKINVRDGKYKVMMDEGKQSIIEYYNVHCDLVISRSKSLAAQKKYKEALALLNFVPPVSRECFDKANEAAIEIGENMPETGPVISDAEEPVDDDKVYGASEEVNLGNNIYLRYKSGETIGEKTYLYFDLINKNEEDYLFKLNRIFKTILINEKGNEVNVNQIKVGSKESSRHLSATIIPGVTTGMICEFPKVREVKYLRLYIHDNYFKLRDLPLMNP